MEESQINFDLLCALPNMRSNISLEGDKLCFSASASISKETFLLLHGAYRCIKEDCTIDTENERCYNEVSKIMQNFGAIDNRTFWKRFEEIEDVIYSLDDSIFVDGEAFCVTEIIISSIYKHIVFLKDKNGHIKKAISIPRYYDSSLANLFAIVSDISELFKEEYRGLILMSCLFVSEELSKKNLDISIYSFVKDILLAIPYKAIVKRHRNTFLHTYLITDSTRLVKIGRTTNVKERIKSLSTGNPSIKTICVIDGDYETILHKQFADKRVKGEWFDLTPEDIEKITKEYGSKILHKI